MAWYTNLYCYISYSRETFNNKNEVIDKIDELKTYIQFCKDRLRNIVIMTEPQKFCPEENDPIIWVENEFRDNLEALEDYTIELYKLELLLDNWDDCHTEDGLAIDPPEDIRYKAYLDGDFVKSIKHPEGK